MKNRTEEYNRDVVNGLAAGQPLDHVPAKKKSSWMKGFFIEPRRSEIDLLTGERISRVKAWKAKLIKSTYVLPILISILPGLGYSADITKAGWEVSIKPGCAVNEFWNQVNTNGFVLVENRTQPTHPENPIAVIRWGTVQNNVYLYEYLNETYHRMKVPFKKSQYDALSTYFKQYGDYIAANATCLKSWGPSGNSNYKANDNSFNTLDMGASLQLSTMESSYPVESISRIYIEDSRVASGSIMNEHWNRYTGEASQFIGAPTSIGSYPEVSHGAEMAFIAATVSNAPISIVAMSNDNGVDRTLIEKADRFVMDLVASRPTEKAIINKSYASLTGVLAEEAQTIRDAAKKGILTIQAMGNEGYKTMRTAQYVNEMLTVGYGVMLVDGFALRSNYGVNGPDLVCDETGKAPINGTNASQNPIITDINYRDYMSSGCTAIISGVASRMYDACTKATPAQIKSALMDSAKKVQTWLPDSPGQIETRVIQPIKAIEKIIATACTAAPTNPALAGATWTQMDWNVYSWAVNPWTNDPVAEKRRQTIAKGCDVKGGKPVLNQTNASLYNCLNNGQPVFINTWSTVVNGVTYFALDAAGSYAL